MCGNMTQVRAYLGYVSHSVEWTRLVLCHAWTFHAIYTCEHMYTVIMHGDYCYSMRVYPLLIAQRIYCIFIDFSEVLALVSHVKTSILTIA